LWASGPQEQKKVAVIRVLSLSSSSTCMFPEGELVSCSENEVAKEIAAEERACSRIMAR
jgi:hypothetical protein